MASSASRSRRSASGVGILLPLGPGSSVADAELPEGPLAPPEHFAVLLVLFQICTLQNIF